MSTKRTGQLGFGEARVPDGRGRSKALDRVAALIDFSAFEANLAGFRESGPGAPGYPPLLMFKALLLQAWHGLSDADLETALGDRLSFARFVGLSLEDDVPDHTTLCRFRNRLIAAGALEGLFGELDRQLEAAGLMVKRGVMLDATLIEGAAARRPPGAPSADPDAAYARITPGRGKGGGEGAGKSGSKRGGTTFGYKAHVGVDCGSGLVRAVVTTPANVNDTVVADALIRGDEREVLADGAYHTHARAAALKARGVKPRLMRRPNRHHPELAPRLKLINRLISRRRAAVETTFATWKRRMGLTRLTRFGLVKAAAQVLLTAMAFNLRRAAALTA